MTVRRSAVHEKQSELPFAVPVPAPGTVIIMRIEDFRSFPSTRPAAPPRPTAADAALQAWLFGQAPTERYGEGVQRSPNGSVLSTTTVAAVSGIFDPAIELPEHSRRCVVGKSLYRLGWRWRYLAGSTGQRERVYFPPLDWQARESDEL